MKKLIITLSIATILGGCASGPGVGQRVFVTAANSAHLSNCEMLGQVEVDASIGGLWDTGEQIKEIKYRLRDETARRFPDADTVTHSDININFWSGPDSNVMGTAFKCFGQKG